MIVANPLLGTALHGVGALSASVCYAPQKGVRRWSWQTYWLAQASFCWFLLPIIGAVLTIPHLGQVLAEAPKEAMRNAFLLGMAYGVGGTAFGIALRYIGFSLTYAIAVGLSSMLGTLLPLAQEGTLRESFSGNGSGWMAAGLAVGTVGIGLCGVAGRLKEIDLRHRQATGEFSLAKGLPLAILAGVLSAVYGLSLHAGEPIADVAERHGAQMFRGNVTYMFSNTGAYITTSLYCLYLAFRQKTFGEFFALAPGSERASLGTNYLLAILTGCLWYGQFFFYNLGHVHLGKEGQFTSWAIHMIILVLFSTLIALLVGEWTGSRARTKTALGAALVVLLSAILSLGYGNQIAAKESAAGAARASHAAPTPGAAPASQAAQAEN